MPFINDRVLDLGLTVLDTEADRLDICSTEPASYAAATTTNTLGNKTPLSVGAPADGAVSGRSVTVAAITDGDVTGTGTATHWAISDTGNSRLIATGLLEEGIAVATGNVFTLAPFTITIPDAA